ncbi:phage major capsid protein [Microlunatus parietis]|uniref:HK97 family phage major capsid protein n=1 Tax=Microlunatus parietis TaxID=682979 RepID=A0A7Y9IB59_9ACTN|nr:phage major capsid protein [Microlunatus parietis]NYE73587.1 HK97 family phage major capsid protein [Microlunatus parietis]
MPMYTADAAQAWLPQDIGDLVTRPVTQESVAITAAGSIRASEDANSYRVPLVAADPTAAWTAEGAEITATDAQFDEVADTFHKLAGLTIISRELAEDTSPDAAQQVGFGLARDIARKLDAAFFGSRGASTLQPLGLADLTGTNTIDAGAAWGNADPFTEAVYAAEGEGAALSAFVANPVDALALSSIKEQTGSNKALLQPDATQANRRLVAGVPLLTSPAVAPGTVWGIPGAGRVVIVIRDDVRLEISREAYFSSDRVGVKATLRATFLYPHELAIQEISLTP